MRFCLAIAGYTGGVDVISRGAVICETALGAAAEEPGATIPLRTAGGSAPATSPEPASGRFGVGSGSSFVGACLCDVGVAPFCFTTANCGSGSLLLAGLVLAACVGVGADDFVSDRASVLGSGFASVLASFISSFGSVLGISVALSSGWIVAAGGCAFC